MQSMPITTEVVSSNSAQVKCKSMQYYIIIVGGFLLALRFPPHNNIESHDIAEILLKVALNTITLTNILTNNNFFFELLQFGRGRQDLMRMEMGFIFTLIVIHCLGFSSILVHGEMYPIHLILWSNPNNSSSWIVTLFLICCAWEKREPFEFWSNFI
jgi:hypothetical protein